jgi:hypothetical protein
VPATQSWIYVVKFADNPHGGRRALVNELIGSVLLSCLGIATPTPAFVEIGDHCVSDGDLLPSGTHFGSRCPGDAVAVYDFLPTTLLHKVSNRKHFIGALMFDHWTSNNESRQAIFFRDLVRPAIPTSGHRGFLGEMIDNGSLFGGSDWMFRESAAQIMYTRPEIYGLDLLTSDFAPWLDALAKLRLEMLSDAVAELPREWIDGDERALDDLLSRLFERRRMLVPAMIQQSIDLLRAGRRSQRVGAASPVTAQVTLMISTLVGASLHNQPFLPHC